MTVNATFGFIVTKTDGIVNSFVPDVLDDKSVAVNIFVNKTVNNIGASSIGPAGFEFVLENTISGEKQTIKSDETGKAVFMLVFTEIDAWKNYTYKLYETDEGISGVTYDTRVYDISISLLFDTNEKMIAKAVIDGKTVDDIVVKFENTYCIEQLYSPPTGDNSNIIISLIFIVSGIACTIIILNKKQEYKKR